MLELLVALFSGACFAETSRYSVDPRMCTAIRGSASPGKAD
jgi:hypothetical protein